MEGWRESARRVAEVSRGALERALAAAVLDLLEVALHYLPYAVAQWPEALELLAERCGGDPTDEDVLAVLDELADKVDLSASLSKAPLPLRYAVGSVIAAARRMWGRDRLERLTYEYALELAEREGAAQLAELMRKYPRLARRVIGWLRECLLK